MKKLATCALSLLALAALAGCGQDSVTNPMASNGLSDEPGLIEDDPRPNVIPGDQDDRDDAQSRERRTDTPRGGDEIVDGFGGGMNDGAMGSGSGVDTGRPGGGEDVHRQDDPGLIEDDPKVKDRHQDDENDEEQASNRERRTDTPRGGDEIADGFGGGMNNGGMGPGTGVDTGRPGGGDVYRQDEPGLIEDNPKVKDRHEDDENDDNAVQQERRTDSLRGEDGVMDGFGGGMNDGAIGSGSGTDSGRPGDDEVERN